MTKIGQATPQIQEFHQSKRAENDARVDAQRDKTEANNDDTMLYWTLNLGKCFKQTLNN